MSDHDHGNHTATAASRSATEFFGRFYSATDKQKHRLLNKAPLADVSVAAISDPDPFTRRDCVFFLDHYANEASSHVFAQALSDPVDFVRNAALHSIACESCRHTPVCAADVFPSVAAVLESDSNPELRIKAISVLLRLADSDSRPREAVRHAAEHDHDEIVRMAARDALAGRHVAPRKRYERRQRHQTRH